jgi:hypothetical protein
LEFSYGIQPLAAYEIPVAFPVSSASHQSKQQDKAISFVEQLVKLLARV